MNNDVYKKFDYMYKYMIGFLFLNFSLYSGIHDNISNKMIQYFPYIQFISLLVIIYISLLDTSSAILLSVSYVLFYNMIEIKKHLRELFTNYKMIL